MKRILCNVGLMAFMASWYCVAQAIPVTYDFSAGDFSSYFGTVSPVSSVSGSFTIDGAVVTQIDLTIGAKIYIPAGVLTDGVSILGGAKCGLYCLRLGVDDFALTGNFSTSTYWSFDYTMQGIFDSFHANTGTLSIHNNAGSVPEPTSIALTGLCLTSLVWTRRRKTRKPV